MSGLTLSSISKRFGEVNAVEALDLHVEPGSFVCLLGPSGCGKTTLLRMIAGLDEPTSGTIRFDGEDITARPVHRREIGMVFQSLALFPHLSVGDNIAYPLAIRGVDRKARAARVEELLDLVRLPGVAGRAITQLSGGQRQRVAIARALSVSPRLFLLDEPLSALDAKLREAMQVELRQLQQRLGITTIVVTHDQREAMTMADRIVVMRSGRIQQEAPPVEIYRRPANAFVADFIGQTNLLPVEGNALLGMALPAAGPLGPLASVRPEDVSIRPAGEAPIEARVAFVRDIGSSVEIHLDAGGTRVVALAPAGARLTVGETVSLAIEAGAVTVFAQGAAA
ncbi:ABC transporter ATP-binding protein [Aureimonas populi]|uniref:ABC transporter ATP-binding protein n=1 Tax=Aureimonas populi TaxID=1701758 RepID=A0ABW5CQY9_9HYPH|nr:ABC transporter ATP-binding protein [Aureimonas populi]